MPHHFGAAKMTLSVPRRSMHSTTFDCAQEMTNPVISAQANMRSAHVKKSAQALFGRSQNDFICAAKIDALFGL
jgi:hypothetical protein